MSMKILAALCVAGVLLSPTLAAAQHRMSRGECLNLVKERLGNEYQRRQEIRAAVDRCVMHGPDAITR
jgi:hypothetical protein